MYESSFFILVYILAVFSFLGMAYYYHRKITKLVLAMSLLVGVLGPVAIIGSLVAVLVDLLL